MQFENSRASRRGQDGAAKEGLLLTKIAPPPEIACKRTTKMLQSGQFTYCILSSEAKATLLLEVSCKDSHDMAPSQQGMACMRMMIRPGHCKCGHYMHSLSYLCSILWHTSCMRDALACIALEWHLLHKACMMQCRQNSKPGNSSRHNLQWSDLHQIL